MILTQSRLKELLHYNPETGLFTWLVSVGHILAGSTAGYTNSDGYRVIMIGGQNYRSARLALFYVRGEWPSDFVDHRDRNPENDALLNLRDATQKQNAENVSRHSDASPGTVGVYWNPRRSQWQAKICHNYKQLHLGWFKDEVLAIAARRLAEIKLFTHGAKNV